MNTASRSSGTRMSRCWPIRCDKLEAHWDGSPEENALMHKIAGPQRSSPEVNARPTGWNPRNGPISRPMPMLAVFCAPRFACSAGAPSAEPPAQRSRRANASLVTLCGGPLDLQLLLSWLAGFGHSPLSSGLTRIHEL
jgi:hypothetical protein